MQSARPKSGPPTLVLIGMLVAAIPSAPLFAKDIAAQRAAFKAVYPAAERGDWTPVEAHADVLQDYVLWPDLRAAWLRARGNRDEAEIRRFLATYGTLKPAREIRYRYARRLAARGVTRIH